jgi:ABC-type Fe3+-hydroxamate transport system substrate-binding protein
MSYEGIWVYGPDDPRSRLLTDLGFVLSPEISKLFVKDYAGMISEEQVQLLDLDAVAWFATEDEAKKLERTACTTASTSTRRTATSSCSTPALTTRTTRSARRRS